MERFGSRASPTRCTPSPPLPAQRRLRSRVSPARPRSPASCQGREANPANPGGCRFWEAADSPRQSRQHPGDSGRPHGVSSPAMFALHPAACQTRAGGFCVRGVRVRRENHLLLSASAAAALRQPLRESHRARAAPRCLDPCSAGSRGGVKPGPPLCLLYSRGQSRTTFPVGGNYPHLSTAARQNGCVSSESAARSAAQSNRVSMWKALIINSTSHPDKALGRDRSRPYPSWADATPLAAQPRLPAQGSR